MRFKSNSIFTILFLLVWSFQSSSLSADPKWVKAVNGRFTGITLFGGKYNGKDVFLCAGFKNGAYHPGSVVKDSKAPGGQVCSYAYDGKEVRDSTFHTMEVNLDLVAHMFVWKYTENGHMPQDPGHNPVELNQYKGKPVYVCRVFYENKDIHAGKLIDKECIFAYNGKEHKSNKYNLLMTRPLKTDTWAQGSDGKVANGENLNSGEFQANTNLLCASWKDGNYHPGQLIDTHCHFGYEGKEHKDNNYHTLNLTGGVPAKSRYLWVDSSGGNIPQKTGFAPIPLGKHNNVTVHICRVKTSHGDVPGKLIGSGCQYPYLGEELSSSNYQVLLSR